MKAVVLLLGVATAALAALPRTNNSESDTYSRHPNGIINPMIVGGEVVVPNSLPHQISLRRNSRHVCGASILNADYIITAAHCAVLGPASIYSVVAGEHSLSKDDGTEQTRTVSKVIIHTSYNQETFANDIALMKLSSSLTLNKNVKAIVIPNADYAVETGNAVVSGWGDIKEDAQKGSDLLRKVSVPIVTDIECRGSYGTSAIFDTMICAGYSAGGKDSCQGDSGGPLTMNVNGELRLIGIVSNGNGCANAGFPGVYTEVAKFNSWIIKNSKS